MREVLASDSALLSFISDIAAFMLKPFFLIGACITAVAFIGTVCAVHFARYGQPPHYPTGRPVKRSEKSSVGSLINLAESFCASEYFAHVS